MRTVCLYDDDQDSTRHYLEGLRGLPAFAEQFRPRMVDHDEFCVGYAELVERRRTARKETPSSPRECFFDSADVLVVDYDLLEALPGDQMLTGEDVAYMARCYSRCGTIVALNRFHRGSRVFDLTLRGHPESHADLNITVDELATPGLWRQPWEGYRPWHWPLIPDAVDAFAARVAELREDDALDKPLLDWLGFPRDVVDTMAREVLEFLGADGGEALQLTFRGFVEKPGGPCLKGRDRADDEGIARIAAARVAAWLEQVVLPGQEILVDAPHLASRFPSLLVGGTSQDSLNQTARLGQAAQHGLDLAKLASAKFPKANWCSRPVWFWQLVRTNNTIAEVRDPWSAEYPTERFCEDISAFVAPEQTREFRAELPSAFDTRYVVDRAGALGSLVAGVEYRPSTRFLL